MTEKKDIDQESLVLTKQNQKQKNHLCMFSLNDDLHQWSL